MYNLWRRISIGPKSKAEIAETRREIAGEIPSIIEFYNLYGLPGAGNAMPFAIGSINEPRAPAERIVVFKRAVRLAQIPKLIAGESGGCEHKQAGESCPRVPRDGGHCG